MSASEQAFTVTPAHLARMLETARVKERARLMRAVENQVDILLGQGHTAAADALRLVSDSIGLAPPSTSRKAVAVQPTGSATAETLADPLLRDIDAEVAQVEGEDTPLPPVRHHDDFAEGAALVRSPGLRGSAAFRD